MPGVLALDLATKFGWAFGSGGEHPRSGSVALPIYRPRDARFAAYSDWLADAITTFEPSRIVYEAPQVTNGGTLNATTMETARFLFGVCAITDLVAWRRDVPCFDVHLSSVRKHFCNSGHAKKREVIRVCHLRGWSPADDNEADALAIWDYALSQKPKLRRAA
jgi:Holliday junction resolvasome RuvABC endonuclease subunit